MKVFPYKSAGPPRGSVGPGAKYLFGGPDDVIMYSSGTRVYWKRGRTLRSSALKSSDCIFSGFLGHSPEKCLNLGSLKWHFPAFCERFWAKSNDLIKSRFLRGPSEVRGPPSPPPPSRRPCKSDTPLKLLQHVCNVNKNETAEFYVVSNDGRLGGSLLSFQTARNLELIAMANNVGTRAKKSNLVECLKVYFKALVNWKIAK